MHLNFPPILAADDYSFLIYVIIGVIWVIASVVKKIAKAVSPSAPRAPRLADEVALRTPPPVFEKRVAPPFVPTPPPVPKGKKKRAEPVQTRAAALAAGSAAPEVVTSVASQSAAPLAAVMRRQLRPETLRRELLMIEILGKPLALRDDPGPPGGG